MTMPTTAEIAERVKSLTIRGIRKDRAKEEDRAPEELNDVRPFSDRLHDMEC